MMKTVFVTLLSFCLLQLNAQTALPIIPVPVKAQIKTGSFKLNEHTVIVTRNETEKNTVDFFNAYLQQYYGFTLKTAAKGVKNFISFSTNTFVKSPDKPERYILDITPASIQIKGDGPQGTFYGMQTLIQLLPVEKSASHLVFLPHLSKIIPALHTGERCWMYAVIFSMWIS